MKIAITGGTGFVGSELTNLLVQKGHEVFILTRSLNKQVSSTHLTVYKNGNDLSTLL